MVSAVRCPSATCRKYMLVEDGDRGAVVNCLVCKAPIRVPAAAGGPPAPASIPSQSGLTPTPYPGYNPAAVPLEPPATAVPAVPPATVRVAPVAVAVPVPPPTPLPVARLLPPPPPRRS